MLRRQEELQSNAEGAEYPNQQKTYETFSLFSTKAPFLIKENYMKQQLRLIKEMLKLQK